MTIQKVEHLDRSDLVDALKAELKIDPLRTAVITIDLHRGHLDPDVATQPLPAGTARSVVENSARLLKIARSARIPVIHVILTLRDVEVATFTIQQAFLKTSHSITPHTTSRILQHNLEGSVQTELMPQLGPHESDYLITNKKTASAFVGTDLGNLLRVLKVDTLVLIGVNTNTCVLSSAFDSFNQGYSTVIISDCVASMYGDDLHYYALQIVSRTIGWVLTIEEFVQKLHLAPNAGDV